MATNVSNHTGWGGNPTTGSNSISQERAMGMPGKYHSMQLVAAGTTGSFTGSNFGYGAVMIGDGAEIGTSHLDVKGGDRIIGTDLSKEVIYDIVPREVVANTGNIYVFKVQG